MRIIDNFLFNCEFDLLEIRLQTEYEHVDQFTIVESDHTFTGMYKGFNLIKQMDRYAPWWDKVKYIQLGKSNHSDPWQVEHASRNQFHSTWNGLTKDDIVIISDCDELIRPEAINFMKETDYDFYRLGMPFFCFKLNFLNTVGHTPWPSTKAFRGYFQQGNDGMRPLNHVPGGRSVELNNAGWHFSYLGDNEWVKKKLASFSHTEWNIPSVTDNLNVDQLLNDGKCFWQPGFSFSPVKIDQYFPEALVKNLSKYSQHIMPDTGKSVLDLLPGTIP